MKGRPVICCYKECFRLFRDVLEWQNVHELKCDNKEYKHSYAEIDYFLENKERFLKEDR